MQKRRGQDKGFTLAEILVVVAIIGIMATIAAPNFSTWTADIRLKGAARELYSNMQMAKINAIKRNSDSAIVFDTTNNKYYFCDNPGVDTTWTGINDAIGTGDNTIVQTIDLNSYKSGIGYGHASIPAGQSATTPAGTFPGDDVSYASNVVIFDSRGIGNGGYVYLQNNKNTVYAVGTQTSGVIMLKKWTGGGWQ